MRVNQNRKVTDHNKQKNELIEHKKLTRAVRRLQNLVIHHTLVRDSVNSGVPDDGNLGSVPFRSNRGNLLLLCMFPYWIDTAIIKGRELY